MFIVEWFNRCNRLILIFIIRTIIITDAKLIREAFSDIVFNGRPENKFINVFSDGKHGLVSAEGPEWIEQRRFAIRNLRNLGFGKQEMEPFILEEVNDLLAFIRKSEGSPIAASSIFNLAVVNALHRIMAGYGYQKQCQTAVNSDSVIHNTIDTFADMTNTAIPIFFPQVSQAFPKYFGLELLASAAGPIHRGFERLIADHRKIPNPEPSRPRDLVDCYLSEIDKTTNPNSSFYKERGLKSMLITFDDIYFAGSGTTSGTMAWCILLLLTHPEVQAKLHKELDDVIGKSRQPSLTDRKKTPFTEAVILEVLRYGTPVPFGIVHQIMNNTTFHGYDLKKGTVVIGNLYSAHNDINTWGDPENFRPERFLREDGSVERHHSAFLAFSTGRRQCAGESLARDQIYLFVTSIFQNFKVKPAPENPKPSIEAADPAGFLLEPKKYLAIFEERC